MADNELTRLDFLSLHDDLEQLQARYDEIVQHMADMENRKLADDTSDAFFQLKREQGDIAQRINFVRKKLANALVINDNANLETVGLGNRVKVYDFETQRVRIFDMVNTTSVEPNTHHVTMNSPIGKAFEGHKSGDQIRVETPDGIKRYRIVEILPMPQLTQ